jgi:SAM-dependent methyltransferase
MVHGVPLWGPTKGGTVERDAWLAERRKATEERFDTVYAPTYDQDDSPMTPTHREFVTRLLRSCPSNGLVLDAACGTGKYFSMIRDAGCRIVGVDQSAGMLAVAHAKHEEASIEKIGLQELSFVEAFDAAICVDAMENVFPEDWPLVLGNLRRALRPGGHLYLTVETIDQQELMNAFADATAQGVPVIQGEHFRRGGGYHYYPPIEQVTDWIGEAGLSVLEEGQSQGSGYGYQHLLTRAQT